MKAKTAALPLLAGRRRLDFGSNWWGIGGEQNNRYHRLHLLPGDVVANRVSFQKFLPSP